MTKNRAINDLVFLKQKLYNGIFQDRIGCIDYAIKALEEVQEYRKLGTVEEIEKSLNELKMWHTDEVNEKIRNVFANTSTMLCVNCDHKDEYIEDLEYENEMYRKLGTVEYFKELKERDTTKEIIEEYSFQVPYYKCPVCGRLVSMCDDFCDNCGQRLESEE